MTATLDGRTEAPAADRRVLERAALVLFFAVVFAVALRPALDNDLWWHLRTADWMLDHHRWVGVDPFTHTRPGVVRVQTDWIAQLVLYGTWRAGGLGAIAVLMAALATFGTGLVHRATSGIFAVRLLVTGAVAAASSVFWVSRPQMATFVLTAAVVLLTVRWRARAVASGGAGPAWLWWLAPLALVWANVHGGVAYGLVFLGALTAGELVDRALPWPARRRLVAVVAAAAVAITLNPSGVRIYGLPFHQVASSAKYVSEVQPPSLHDPWVWPFFVLLAATVVLAVRSWRHLGLADVLPVAAAALLALRFTRSIPFFATVAAPFLAAQASAWWGARRVVRPPASPMTLPEQRRLWVAVALVVAAVVVTTPFRVTGARVDEAEAASFPVGATEWLNAHRPPGELFNSFDWGGYLMLRAPEYRVAIDGRTDVYDEFLDTYVDVAEARDGWETELDREGVNVVVLQAGTPLVAALTDDGGWDEPYHDGVAAVFVRRAALQGDGERPIGTP